jgi:shikimate kinase
MDPTEDKPPAAQKFDRSIVLVGLMGSGKSSVGRRLAARLGMPFRDADDEIEAAAGCSVSEFFARHGEPAFREGERKVIARLLEGPPIVLATGGGAFMDAATRAVIRQNAWSVWLRANLDTLVERTGRRRGRPLLEQGDPRAVLSALMDARYPVYAEAEVVVESGEGPHEDVVEAIVRALRAPRLMQPASA